jgi:hypothetical protein
MRAQFFRLFLSLTLCAVALTVARAQGEQQSPPDEEVTVRGAFLTTRPTPERRQQSRPADPPARQSSANANTSPKNGQTTARVNNSNKATNKGGRDQTAKNTTKTTTKGSTPVKNAPTENGSTNATATFTNAGFNPAAIGLGYTFYMKDINGDAVRVEPSRVFRSGEAIRLSLEANTDGYLYVFYTENGGKPQMIFPDWRLGRGSNYVRAHVPYEVPSNMEANESLRWFTFDDKPATEKLYIVLTREPLPSAPTGETLVTYCQDPNNTCPWIPPASLWSQLTQTQERELVAVSEIKDEGRPQTAPEREATTRGLGLAADAPQPTVIRMNASSTTGLLVTSITLTHK